MKTDKELIREGKYQEALGVNYSPRPYSIIVFANPNSKVPREFFATVEEVKKRALELEIGDYIIGDLNADWL